MDEKIELFNLLDLQSKVLVGILLKRIEVLEEEKVLTASLYKKIVKESVYEAFRNLKTIITIGKLNFTSKPKE